MATVIYLQQTDPEQLRPATPAAVAIERVEADPLFNERMYRVIGADWNWGDRSGWTADDWAAYAKAPGMATYRAVVGDRTAGYCEFRTTRPPGADGTAVEVEIAQFGLLPEYTGRGLGGWLLTEVLRTAWQTPGCSRVWLHTCTDDSPAALPNYLARGMIEYRRETD